MDNKKAEGIEVTQSKAIKEKKTRKEKYKEKLEEQLLPRKKTIMINGKKVTLIQNFLFPICEDKIRNYIEECVNRKFSKKNEIK